MKRSYEAPELRVVGSVRALTLAATDGDQLDADFPDNTPRGDLTFS
ncbi:MAG: lasso RiPP family leader peptide-containing protein [Actinomycetes bacterium]